MDCTEIFALFVEKKFATDVLTHIILQQATDDAVFRMLPLFMIIIEDIGRNDRSKTSGELEAMLHVFRERIASRRWIKARFLLLCNLPCFRSYWSLDHIHRNNAYTEGAFDFQTNDSIIDDTLKRSVSKKFEVNHLKMRLPVDITDVQGIAFWTKTVHDKKVETGHKFPLLAVSHPMYGLADDAPTGGEANDQSIIQSIVVEKVLSSIARPKIIALRRVADGVKLSAIADRQDSVSPKLMIKAGDNLMTDVGVMMLFRCFNAIWAADSSLRKQYGADLIPTTFTYEITPTTASTGHIELLTNLLPLAKFPWNEWASENKKGSDVVNEMVRTAVAGYIAAYVLGVRDRHYDNVLITNKRTMLHIDFSYVLGDVLPVDGPPMSISPGMEAGFKSVGVWGTFVELSVDAFRSLRKNSDVILRFAALQFSKAGFEEDKTRKFLESAASLNMKKGEGAALKKLKTQILGSSKHIANSLKTVVHDSLQGGWYKQLQEGFSPAQKAMEAYNEMAQERNRRMEESKVKIEDENALVI